MAEYFILRLGADSEPEIERIDAQRDYSSRPFSIDVKCKQVPKEIRPGDFAIIWLGTNNNKGGKTPWVQGIRALGRITDVSGDESYNASKTVTVTVGVVLPRSVTKMDFVTQRRAPYQVIAAMPVLGVNNYSSQVVQRIDSSKPAQNLSALFEAIEANTPGFKPVVLERYPELSLVLRSDTEIFDSLLDQQTIYTPESTVAVNEASPAAPQEIEEDADGLELEERGSDIEVPFDPTKIDIIAKPMTISSLEDRLQNAELDLTPDFQRQANVWDVKRKARLIESILLKIPLPSFYFSEDSDGGYAVVDGLQRLCAVFHFKNSVLLNRATGANLLSMKLKGLQYLKELEGKSYDQLDRKFQRRVSELEITANIIRANTPSAVKFNVFARLNQGGLPLNAQEIRNAIFPGEWRNELRKMAESPKFIAATNGKVQTARQQDMELVLRYVALWQLDSPYRRPGGQTLDEFLNATVEHALIHWGPSKWDAVRQAFHHSIDATSEVFGRLAFRKSMRSPINRGLFEAQLIVFGSLDQFILSEAVQNKGRVRDLFMKALNENEHFIRALLYGTGSAEASFARIVAFGDIVKEAISA